MSARRRFVHVFATFGRGGPQVRAVQLMQHLGDEVEHVVQAMDGNTDARELLPASSSVTFAAPPPRGSFFATRKVQAAWLGAQRPDLVLTYNWGAIESVAAARRSRLPLVHHEDGFGPEEVERRLRRRNWMRRWLLRSVPVVVPSTGLQQIARREWGVTAQHLVNGVDLVRFAPAPQERQPLVVGTVGGLRPEKDYAVLLQAVASMQREVRLVLVGGGALEAQLRAEAERLSLAERVEFCGFTNDTAPHYRTFSVFAMSSRTEQMPIALVEAMASGLPVAATDVGDIRAVVSEPNQDLIVPPRDPRALAMALDRLGADRDLRARLGAANRAVAERRYEAVRCLQRFCDVYRAAMR
jgi:glycosyltransferase involved in cell wall biosynthesis